MNKKAGFLNQCLSQKQWSTPSQYSSAVMSIYFMSSTHSGPMTIFQEHLDATETINWCKHAVEQQLYFYWWAWKTKHIASNPSIPCLLSEAWISSRLTFEFVSRTKSNPKSDTIHVIFIDVTESSWMFYSLKPNRPIISIFYPLIY